MRSRPIVANYSWVLHIIYTQLFARILHVNVDALVTAVRMILAQVGEGYIDRQIQKTL